MTETDKKIQDLKKRVEQLENRQKDTLDFIEETCSYDEHLLGYIKGIERCETGKLVYKLTGKFPRDLERK